MDDNGDFACVSKIPAHKRKQGFLAQLRVWNKEADQYVVVKCSEPTSEVEARLLARTWARDHKCEFRDGS